MTALSTTPQLQADLLLLVGREDRDDPVHRLGGVQGVQGAEHQVARLRGGEGRLDGLVVAHLTHEDHVRVLPEGAAQGAGEALGVHLHFPLVHQALLVAVEELDGILHRHDVLRPGAVDVVDHGGQAGGLSRPGGPGHQDQPPGLVGDGLDDRRKQELLERQDLGGNDPEDQPHRAPLLEDVDAEPPQARDRVGDVDLIVVLELLLLPAAHDGERHGDAVLLDEARQLGQGNQLSVDADHRMAADLEMEVRGLPFRGDLQQVVDFHPVPPRGS